VVVTAAKLLLLRGMLPQCNERSIVVAVKPYTRSVDVVDTI
jgi:hypothetical protein